MECRYPTPTGGSAPEWERKTKYPPEPRDRASRASRAARLPESTQILARRAKTSWRGALRAARQDLGHFCALTQLVLILLIINIITIGLILQWESCFVLRLIF